MDKMPDLSHLTAEDLFWEYGELFKRCQKLQEANEADTQKIFQLKNSLKVATTTETYLSQELEQLMSSENIAAELEKKKLEVEFNDLKKKNHSLMEDLTNLQQDYDNLSEEFNLLRNEVLSKRFKKPYDDLEATHKETIQRLLKFENENMELLSKLEALEETNMRNTLTITENNKNLEILNDKINCLQETLSSKREELVEKADLLECTQEQLAEANAKIAMFNTDPDEYNFKGNSLFAEVDDQRQAMKQLLANQKKSYLLMKKACNDSEQENRKLKRENSAMQIELQVCSRIFGNSDKVYQEKLRERISHLQQQNDGLEAQLRCNEDRLKDLSIHKNVPWIASILTSCRQETADLKRDLHGVRIQKGSLDEELRNSQQLMARWRFESLKSRVLIADREYLLIENNIPFKPLKEFDFRFSPKKVGAATPRIMNVVESTNSTPERPKIVDFKPEPKSPEPSLLNQVSTEQTFDCGSEMKEEVTTSENIKTSIKQSNVENDVDSDELCQSVDHNLTLEENKENEAEPINKLKLTPMKKHYKKPSKHTDKFNFKSEIKKKAPPNTQSLPGPSILIKKPRTFDNDTAKRVHFPKNESSIHTFVKNDDCTLQSENNKSNNKSVKKEPRTTSYVVVRHLKIDSKKPK